MEFTAAQLAERLGLAVHGDPAARVSGVPRLPDSPRVKSTSATRRPAAVARATVPPMMSSASSGCAQIPAMSNGTKPR